MAITIARSLLTAALTIGALSCAERPAETPAAKAAPIAAPVTPADDPIPAALRAELPPGAVLNKVIAGDGVVTQPTDGGESHQRHPYDLPTGAGGIVAVVRWQDAAWPDVEIAVGIGLCPHRGRKLASARGADGEAAVHHAVQMEEALAEDRWFLHVNGDAGLAANPGKSLKYAYAVYSY